MTIDRASQIAAAQGLTPEQLHQLSNILHDFATRTSTTVGGDRQAHIEERALERIQALFQPKLANLQDILDRVVRERDDADRRAGAAARQLEYAQDSASRRSSWLDKAKKEWGVDSNVSFDVVWAEALALKARYNGSAISTEPALPFTCAGLQMHMEQFGMDRAETFAVAQRLYELGFISYPKTDSAYLPENLHAEAGLLLGLLRNEAGALVKEVYQADPSIKGPAFNDAKVTAHHGIIIRNGFIVTELDRLSFKERQVWTEIARRFVQLFVSVPKAQ